jgi:glycerol kinase
MLHNIRFVVRSHDFRRAGKANTVAREAVTETTGLGAAYLAGLATGFWKNNRRTRKYKVGRQFKPSMPAETAKETLAGQRMVDA